MADEFQSDPAPTANAVRAEEGKLTRDEQALDTDRAAHQMRYGGEANQPTGEDPEPDTAASRLRAFEDDRFGEDAVRINDKIERGYGSPFAAMSDADKLHYTALERLVVAEQKVTDANAALMAAQMAYDTAVANVDAAIKVADDAKAKAEKQEADRQARADAKANRQPATV